jgi:hypothetical protein
LSELVIAFSKVRILQTTILSIYSFVQCYLVLCYSVATMDYWRGRTAVIATMHEKERWIAPVLEHGLGVRTLVPVGFDTDRFGTFTREKKRVGDQWEAARAKARAALKETGHDLAVASEGSFGPDPRLPLVTSGLELVLLVDLKHNLEIAGLHRSTDVNVQRATVRSADEAVTMARTWGFPEQGVIVRRSATSTRGMEKEAQREAELRAAAARLLRSPLTRSIYLETDLRAHRHPKRQPHIETATKDLVQNCRSRCPSCSVPGFAVANAVSGRPCQQCRQPTELAQALLYRCSHCGYSKERPVPAAPALADPSECSRCNP